MSRVCESIVKGKFPQNFGPMAPFFLEKTGYTASMVGFPYDDIRGWSGIYPTDVYEDEYRQLVEGWSEGVESLLAYQGMNDELDEMILMARAVLCQFESAYHHIQFVNRRNSCQEELLGIIEKEMATVQALIDIRLQDSRIGFESSNHYFYTMQDLKEKMINLAYCKEQITTL